MNRRAFLSLLGAGAAGTVMVGQMEALQWVPKAEPIYAVPPAVVGHPQTIEDITREALRLLDERLAGYWMPPGERGWSLNMVDGVRKLGEDANGIQLTEQLAISLDTEPGEPIHTERYIVPAAYALAEHMKRKNVRVLAPLRLPPEWEAAIATHPTHGLALRGLRGLSQPHLPPDHPDQRVCVRFDVLGGRV